MINSLGLLSRGCRLSFVFSIIALSSLFFDLMNNTWMKLCLKRLFYQQQSILFFKNGHSGRPYFLASDGSIYLFTTLLQKSLGKKTCLMTSKVVCRLTLRCKTLKLYNAIKHWKVGAFPQHNLIARMCLQMENKGIVFFFLFYYSTTQKFPNVK